MTRAHPNVTATIIASGTAIATIYDVLFLSCGDVEHSGICRIGEEVAHSFLLPWMNTTLELVNTPPSGTGPSRSLNDRFRNCKELRDSKNSGILPDKLFWERSISAMPRKLMNEFRMLPCRNFPPGEENPKECTHRV